MRYVRGTTFILIAALILIGSILSGCTSNHVKYIKDNPNFLKPGLYARAFAEAWGPPDEVMAYQDFRNKQYLSFGAIGGSSDGFSGFSSGSSYTPTTVVWIYRKQNKALFFEQGDWLNVPRHALSTLVWKLVGWQNLTSDQTIRPQANAPVEPRDTSAIRKAMLEKFKETHPDFDNFRTEIMEVCKLHPEWDQDLNGLPKIYEAARRLAMAKVESRAKELGLDPSELELFWELSSEAPNLPLDDRIKWTIALIRRTTWVGSWNNDKDGTYGDLTVVIIPNDESSEKLSGRIIIIYQSFKIGMPFHGDRISLGKYKMSGYRSIPDLNLSMTLDSIIQFNEATGIGGGTYRLRSEIKGNQHDDEGNFILGKKSSVGKREPPRKQIYPSTEKTVKELEMESPKKIEGTRKELEKETPKTTEAKTKSTEEEKVEGTKKENTQKGYVFILKTAFLMERYYHRSGCSRSTQLQSISPSSYTTVTVEEAVRRGYSPCPICKP